MPTNSAGDNMGSLPSSTGPQPTILLRRVSLAGAPAKPLILPSELMMDRETLELVPLKDQHAAYTSLRDILRASLSPPPPTFPAGGFGAGQAWSEIRISNRLVKQAALAYLQPMASPEASGNDLFGRRWQLVLGDLRRRLAAGIHFFRQWIYPAITRAFGCLVRLLWIGSSRDG